MSRCGFEVVVAGLLALQTACERTQPPGKQGGTTRPATAPSP